MNAANLRKHLAALLLVSTASASAQTYDLVTAFSPTSNPSGPWSWGSSDSLGGRFTAFSTKGPYGGVMNLWTAGTFGTIPWPASVYALADPPAPQGCAQITNVEICPHTVGFHPGAGAEVTTFRFTAPAAGSYVLDAFFFGQDFSYGTSSQIGVSLNGQLQGALLDVDGFDPQGGGAITGSQGLRATLFMAGGDLLDISVGNRGDPYFDATGLRATITASAVPEPGGAWLMLAGLVGACLHRRSTGAGRHSATHRP